MTTDTSNRGQANNQPPTPPVRSKSASGSLFQDGISLLRGDGAPQDFGMAAARMLDASDYGHPAATFYAALMYFCGVGVSRNIQSAREYALKYLQMAPDGPFKASAKEIVDGSLGTKNAEKILFSRPDQIATSASKRKLSLPLLVGVGVVILIGIVASFMLIRSKVAPSAVQMAADIKIDQLLTKEEIDQANKEALTIAASLQSNAKLELQQENQRAEAAEAERQAQEEQRKHAEEEAIAQAEAKAKAQAEADAKAQEAQARARAEQEARALEYAQRQAEAQARAQAAAQATASSAQTRNMLASARTAAQQGQYDRALGMVDSILASQPNNRDALTLQNEIRNAQTRALRSMVIR